MFVEGRQPLILVYQLLIITPENSALFQVLAHCSDITTDQDRKECATQMILPAYKTLGIRDEKKQKAEINLFVNIFELAFQFRKIFLSFILIKGKQKIKYSATFINTKSKKVTKQKKYKFRCGIAPSLIDGVSSVGNHDHRLEITLFSLSSYNIIT